jgi:hypothetical protein
MIFLLIVGATKAKQVKEIINKITGAVQLLADGGKAKKD